jgi:hypothetical protein
MIFAKRDSLTFATHTYSYIYGASVSNMRWYVTPGENFTTSGENPLMEILWGVIHSGVNFRRSSELGGQPFEAVSGDPK